MFITIEDETGVANLILWPDRFERQGRLVLSAGMIACHGKVHREGDVTHVITDRLEDLSDLLRSVGERDEAFPLTHGRGDGATHPGTRTHVLSRVPDRVDDRSGTSTFPTYTSAQASRSRRGTFADRRQPQDRRLWWKTVVRPAARASVLDH